MLNNMKFELQTKQNALDYFYLLMRFYWTIREMNVILLVLNSHFIF